MTQVNELRYFVDLDGLPDQYPTHKHESAFWESLGRAVATFGFLEEVLAKAIFAFTATRPYNEAEIQQAYTNWLLKLEKALKDTLWNLIKGYENAVRNNPDATIDNLDELLDNLRKISRIRNILCHGSWRLPDISGASIPFFVNTQMEVVDRAMDRDFIDQVQRHSAILACEVVSTVTQMGWQFPGSDGPGNVIWKSTTQHQDAPGRKTVR